jgi:regulator of sirC expression with transglutaminase-like and TPR domain
MQVDEQLQSLTGSGEGSVDLAEGALLIAADEYPQLDIPDYLRKLDVLGSKLRRRLRTDVGPTESILALNRYLFEELNFQGASEDYYDPRNSFLNEVLERRVGIPITLSIVYMVVGRCIGLALHGVSFPGHFLVRCPVRDGIVVLDPFHRGISLGIDDLQERVASLHGGAAPSREEVVGMLAAASNREILARLLRNLRGIYLHFEQLPQALAATSRILVLTPDNAGEWRERAGLYLRLECFRPALADYQRYVTLAPEADDIEIARARIVELQGICAKLN